MLLLVPNARQFKTYPVCPKSAKAVFGAKAGRPRLTEAEKQMTPEERRRRRAKRKKERGEEKAAKKKHKIAARSKGGGDRPYTCTHSGCGRAFARQSNLATHMRTHTGDRPYTCTHSGCCKAFTRQSNLERHMRTHSGDRCPQGRLAQKAA